MLALLRLVQPLTQVLLLLMALAFALSLAYGLHRLGLSWWAIALSSAMASLAAQAALQGIVSQALRRIPLFSMIGSLLPSAPRRGVVATTNAKPALSQAHALAKLKAELAVATDTNHQLQAKIASLEVALQKALSR